MSSIDKLFHAEICHNQTYCQIYLNVNIFFSAYGAVMKRQVNLNNDFFVNPFLYYILLLNLIAYLIITY